MNWSGIEENWKQRSGDTAGNLVNVMNNKTAAVTGKHEQLVENLLKKYGVAKKGEYFNKFFEDKIAQSIELLPGNLRSVVLLSDVEELRYTEIAKTLACPVGTVRSRLHRGRKILQQKLLSYSEVDGSLVGKFDDSEQWQKKMF